MCVLTRGKRPRWCRYVVVLQVLHLGLAVVLTSCSRSFARATYQQRQSDHETVMCAFTGSVSLRLCFAGARRRSEHKHAVCVFTGEQRPGDYKQLFVPWQGSVCLINAAVWGCGIRAKTPGSNPTTGTKHFALSESYWVQVRPVRRSSTWTLRRLLNSMTRLPLLLNLRVRGLCPHGCLWHEASGQCQQSPCLLVAGAKRQINATQQVFEASSGTLFNPTSNG